MRQNLTLRKLQFIFNRILAAWTSIIFLRLFVKVNLKPSGLEYNIYLLSVTIRSVFQKIKNLSYKQVNNNFIVSLA